MNTFLYVIVAVAAILAITVSIRLTHMLKMKTELFELEILEKTVHVMTLSCVRWNIKNPHWTVKERLKECCEGFNEDVVEMMVDAELLQLGFENGDPEDD